MRAKERTTLLFTLPVLVGLGLRLLMVLQLHAPWGDNGAAILDVAKNISLERGFTTQRIWTFHGPAKEFGQPEGNRQPLLPLCEAGVRRWVGPGFRAAQAIPFLFGLAAMILIARCGWRLGGVMGGVIAAWFAALDPLQIYFSAQIEDQIVFLVWFLLLCNWLIRSPSSRPGGWPLIPGLLLALMYLTRSNGLLFLVAYVILAFRNRQQRHAVAVFVVFLVLSAPWLIRNIRAFGNPIHTDNAFFLYADDFWDVFSIRSGPPSALEFLSSHSPLQIALRWLRGAYLCGEDFLLGNIFKHEPFARGALTTPIVLAVYGLWNRRNQSFLQVAALAFMLHFISLSWHAHGTYRYFMPFYALIFVGASVGLVDGWKRFVEQARPKVRMLFFLGVFFLLVFPLIRPLASTVGRSDRAAHLEAMEVVRWIQREADPDMIIMDFPVIEKYLYLYDLPTVMTPYGSLDDIWKVAQEYRVTHLVICREQLERISSLGTYWHSCDTRLVERDPPSFLTLVYRSKHDGYLVYRIDRQAFMDPRPERLIR